MFTRQAEVIFHPGNERLGIKQQFNGIDQHDHLVVSTELEGRLPAIPPGSSVQINSYKEIYQYDRDRKDDSIFKPIERRSGDLPLRQLKVSLDVKVVSFLCFSSSQ